MKEFLEFIAKHLVDNPDAVVVEETESDGKVLLKLYVDDKEIGKVIGRAGRNAKAMRVLLSAIGAKEKKKVTLEIPDRVNNANWLLELLPDINKFLHIGKITKTVGLKGSFKIISLSDIPERFKITKEISIIDDDNRLVLINKNTGSNLFEIEKFTENNSKFSIKLKGYDDINSVLDLVGKYICIKENERKELDKGEYYLYEFIDINVYSDNLFLGKIIRVENFGGDNLLLVEANNSNEFYIPLRKEFIKKINLSEKRIDVQLIEGLSD